MCYDLNLILFHPLYPDVLNDQMYAFAKNATTISPISDYQHASAFKRPHEAWIAKTQSMLKPLQ